MELGIRKMEPREPENGTGVPKNGPSEAGTLVSTLRHTTRPACPGTPGQTLFKYIRSGPEGARGVLEV